MDEKGKLIFIAWTLGLCGGILIHFLRVLGIIKVSGYQKSKFTIHKRGLIIIYRHPSLREPAILPFLIFPWYLLNVKFVPYSVPATYYYNKWWFRILRPVCIPIETENRKALMQTLENMKTKLDKGGIIIMAPGGGREFKGTIFKAYDNDKFVALKLIPEENYNELVKEFGGKIIRRFQSGIGWIIENTEAKVLPVWVENHGIRTWINIGDLIQPQDHLSRKEKIEFFENCLLRLRD